MAVHCKLVETYTFESPDPTNDEQVRLGEVFNLLALPREEGSVLVVSVFEWKGLPSGDSRSNSD